MIRAVSVASIVAVLLIGCVSLPPTVTSQPTSGATQKPATPAPATVAPTPTAAPTAPPTAPPTPTMAPTDTPTQEPTTPPVVTPEPTQTAIVDFGANTPLFVDDFSDPSSGWFTTSTGFGSIEYQDGAFVITSTATRNWFWSGRVLDTSTNVVHVEGTFTPSADGIIGLFCRHGTDELYGGGVTTAGGWAFARIDPQSTAEPAILSTNGNAGWVVPAGQPTRLALDCAGTATGSFRMQLSLPDSGLAATFEQPDGPADFSTVALYTQALTTPYSASVDDVFAYGGDGTSTAMSPAAQALLQHIPEDWHSLCFEGTPDPFELGALADVSCVLAGGKSDFADYVQFDSKDDMDAAYQARVDTWKVDGPTVSCNSGPNEGEYTIGGTTAGRILCAPQTAGIRIDWTHNDLLILTTLTDFEGSYPDTYDDWLIAGPD